MFGLMYALFMGGACIVDSIKKDIEESEAQQRSKQNGGTWAIGSRGNYWNGIKAYTSGLDTPKSHYVIKTLDGRILKDYTQERFDEAERKDEERFYNDMKEARENGEYYFRFDPFFFSDGDFKLYHPIGYYEVDTLKRFHTMTKGKKHYKMYDKVEPWYPEWTNQIGFTYEADEDNAIEISEAEWKRSGGEKNQIRNEEILFKSPGYEYRYQINHYRYDNKRGRR